MGTLVGDEDIVGDGHAAGIRVLDNHAGRHLETAHAFPGGVGVGDIVVRQLLALQLPVMRERAGGRLRFNIERCLLMRVLAVTHCLRLRVAQVEPVGKGLQAGLLAFLYRQRGEVVGDHAVIFGGMRERFFSERKTGCGCCGAVMHRHLFHQARVVAGIGDDGDEAIILGGSAHHRRPADVDIFNRIVQCDIRFGDSRGEWIQIHHHHIDGRNMVRGHCFRMVGQVAARQDAAMHLGVQGLDAAVHHFRKAGVVADLGDCHAVILQQLGGAAGGKNLYVVTGKKFGELEHARFIGHADQGAPDADKG